MDWDYLTVYQALVARNERQKGSETDQYVTLYQPQPLGKNCALLYKPGSARYSEAPVHLHSWSIPPRENGPPRDYWQDDVFLKIKPTIEFVGQDKPHKPFQSFSHYRVLDWNRFAEALGLEAADKDSSVQSSV